MIKIENYEVVGWEHAIRGMRNPKNSWERSDTIYIPDMPRLDYHGNVVDIVPAHYQDVYKLVEQSDSVSVSIGPNDHTLMMNLAKGGSVHAKYRRMIAVYVDITAPLYWWKEFDTYKVGTVANSCSTMHKIQAKEFTLDDFSCEHLFMDSNNIGVSDEEGCSILSPKYVLDRYIITLLNDAREKFIKTNDKKYWWQMIQLLPSSYNQKRTVMLNYEVLSNIYIWRKNHKLDEWVEFCKWIESLPYSEIITGEE